MSGPTYFKSAADHHDWWFISGAALGGRSPGETFKFLHEQLSEAGANSVVAWRFLQDNDRGVDTRFWRRAFVYGHVVFVQVALTLRALEAIGAVGIVRSLRSAPAQPSGIGLAREMVRSGDYNPAELREVVQGLREDIAVGASRFLDHGTGAINAAGARPRPDEGVESREVVRRLLDEYVAAHRDELARNVAKHGDPRRVPGFDPQAATEARARSIRSLNYRKYQGEVIDGFASHWRSSTPWRRKRRRSRPASTRRFGRCWPNTRGSPMSPPRG